MITIRDQIVTHLKETGEALTSEVLAKRLNLTMRQMQEANTELKKQGRIIADNKRPQHFSVNKNQINSLSKRPIVKSKFASRKINEKSPIFKFNNFLILYVTNDSPVPKMFHDFQNEEELIAKFEELQKLTNLVTLAVFKKLEVVQKYELKI